MLQNAFGKMIALVGLLSVLITAVPNNAMAAEATAKASDKRADGHAVQVEIPTTKNAPAKKGEVGTDGLNNAQHCYMMLGGSNASYHLTTMAEVDTSLACDTFPWTTATLSCSLTNRQGVSYASLRNVIAARRTWSTGPRYYFVPTGSYTWTCGVSLVFSDGSMKYVSATTGYFAVSPI